MAGLGAGIGGPRLGFGQPGLGGQFGQKPAPADAQDVGRAAQPRRNQRLGPVKVGGKAQHPLQRLHFGQKLSVGGRVEPGVREHPVQIAAPKVEIPNRIQHMPGTGGIAHGGLRLVQPGTEGRGRVPGAHRAHDPPAVPIQRAGAKIGGGLLHRLAQRRFGQSGKGRLGEGAAQARRFGKT